MMCTTARVTTPRTRSCVRTSNDVDGDRLVVGGAYANSVPSGFGCGSRVGPLRLRTTVCRNGVEASYPAEEEGPNRS